MRPNIAKLIGICVAMVCITVLMVSEHIEQNSGSVMLASIVFYLIGNGVNAKRGKGDVAVLQPKPEGRRADDGTPDTP